MGRPRKSDAEKAAKGTLQRCRITRIVPAGADEGAPALSETPPAGLPGDAAELWRLAVKYAPPGRLTVVDAPVLERWVRTYATWRKAQKLVEHGEMVDVNEESGVRKPSVYVQIAFDANSLLLKIEKELGFTPLARVRAPAREEEPPAASAFEQLKDD